ncbi:MAG TPA: hypothetical protein GX734_06615 [Clostridiaceae bacterium]|nr:hypothetical protein [Clostridiaceae bacterium]
MNEKTVEFKNINKAFGPIIANDDISLALRKGEVHAIIEGLSLLRTSNVRNNKPPAVRVEGNKL